MNFVSIIILIIHYYFGSSQTVIPVQNNDLIIGYKVGDLSGIKSSYLIIEKQSGNIIKEKNDTLDRKIFVYSSNLFQYFPNNITNNNGENSIFYLYCGEKNPIIIELLADSLKIVRTYENFINKPFNDCNDSPQFDFYWNEKEQKLFLRINWYDPEGMIYNFYAIYTVDIDIEKRKSNNKSGNGDVYFNYYMNYTDDMIVYGSFELRSVAYDEKNNQLFFSMDSLGPTYFYNVFHYSLNEKELIDVYGFDDKAEFSFNLFQYCDGKLFGVWYDDSRKFSHIGYLDLKSRNRVSLKTFEGEYIWNYVGVSTMNSKDGLYYVVLEDFIIARTYWMIFDMKNQELKYFSKSEKIYGGFISTIFYLSQQ